MSPKTEETAAIVGLASQEAQARLQQYGPNDPAPLRRSSAVLDLLRLAVPCERDASPAQARPSGPRKSALPSQLL
jgi:hypothetical protein